MESRFDQKKEKLVKSNKSISREFNFDFKKMENLHSRKEFQLTSFFRFALFSKFSGLYIYACLLKIYAIDLFIFQGI